MCLYPKLIKNPKYTATKKNGGTIPAVTDSRVLFVPVGCGNCMECRQQKARHWQTRILEDIKTNKKALFVTLTLNNESYQKLNKESKATGYTKDNEIITIAVRRYLERHRKEHKTSTRHWFVTELGHNGTENIHVHGIIWNNTIQNINKHWQYGYIYPRSKEEQKINYVNEQTVNYIVKYITKIDQKHKHYKSIILTSAGIGKNYTETKNAKNNTYNGEKTNETYRTRKGNKTNLPIYWRNKIYTEGQREKLWLYKLDKEERYILGNKISIKNGDKEYQEALKYAQQVNNELGYGSDSINWEEYQYERDRRLLMQKTRLMKDRPKDISSSEGQ